MDLQRVNTENFKRKGGCDATCPTEVWETDKRIYVRHGGKASYREDLNDAILLLREMHLGNVR
jgi:hypothetical protein